MLVSLLLTNLGLYLFFLLFFAFLLSSTTTVSRPDNTVSYSQSPQHAYHSTDVFVINPGLANINSNNDNNTIDINNHGCSSNSNNNINNTISPHNNNMKNMCNLHHGSDIPVISLHGYLFFGSVERLATEFEHALSVCHQGARVNHSDSPDGFTATNNDSMTCDKSTTNHLSGERRQARKTAKQKKKKKQSTEGESRQTKTTRKREEENSEDGVTTPSVGGTSEDSSEVCATEGESESDSEREEENKGRQDIDVLVVSGQRKHNENDQKLAAQSQQHSEPVDSVIVLDMTHVLGIDVSAHDTLLRLVKTAHMRRVHVAICGKLFNYCHYHHYYAFYYDLVFALMLTGYWGSKY